MKDDFEIEPGLNEPKRGGGNARLLLLILLLLVAVFGYLYYFTGLIKPREEAKAPEPVQTAQVKQPIPPRPEEKPAGTQAPAQPAAGTATKEAPPVSPAAAKPGEKKGEPAKPSADKGKAVAPKPAKNEPAAKPARTEAASQKKEGAKPVVVAKVLPKGETKTGGASSAGSGTPTASAKDIKKEGATSAKKKTASKEKGVKVARAAVKKSAGPSAASAMKSEGRERGEFTLRIGEYVVADAMERDKEKVQDSGLTPVVKQGAKKKEPMVRLYLAEFDNRESAGRELANLKDATVDGFILKEGGKYVVYAGSYFLHDRAVKEQQRLAALGIKPSLRKTSVSVPTLVLTAGKFTKREDAVKTAAKLKQKGLRSVVVESRKP
ncbi:SPOR domain-containing protein [Geobacter sp.]|uniref:SPOR domain-containing protein n=1 Tax=Geobacter sp. TaxID=46610 RepID=UPI00260AB206|nr:SPOR domain-containing protein [Geobacter sp.]